MRCAEFEFEHASKPEPVQTTESTTDLETMIKRRIADQLWDDVERKEDTLGADKATTSLPDISEEKSKEGLGDLYEKDYREQVMGEVAEDEMSKEEQAISGKDRQTTKEKTRASAYSPHSHTIVIS